jgi:transposase
MSTASGSSRSCAGFGEASAVGSGLWCDHATSGCISTALCSRRAGRPAGCSCPRSIPPPFLWRSRLSHRNRGWDHTSTCSRVADQAGWHKSRDLRLPEGLHLLFLPSHSPELQPAERLWPLTNEPLANRVFRSRDCLEDVQAERCRWLQAHPDIIRGRTSFHWWPSLDTT